MSAMSLPRRTFFQANVLPLIFLGAGLGFGLAVSIFLLYWLMSPSREEMMLMINTISMWAIVSTGVGFVLYRLVVWQSRSLIWTFAFASLWAAVLSLFNVWGVARLMFFESHDYMLTIVLLIFAAIIATTFGISTTTRTTHDLRSLADTAAQIAEGDLSIRAAVYSQDEVGYLATSFNQMAEQLQTAEQQREELEKLRRDLIAWTSHDLRTPLTSIWAMVEALHDGLVTDSEAVQRYYRTIRADIVALNNLLNDLFELAQLDAGGLEMTFESYLLGDLISDALESFHAVAQQRRVTLLGRVESDLTPTLMDASKIGRVLNNLISNALNYTPEGGTIHVEATRLNNEIQVTVQDSGLGFAPAELTRVFEKFYRGEKARTRAKGGAGLGLAIAQGIVEAHHGRIWAENAPKGGAVIRFTLPTT